MFRDQGKSGISIVVVRYLAKVMAPVRFRYPAQKKRRPISSVASFSLAPSGGIEPPLRD